MPPRMLDLACANCGAEVNDLFVRNVPPRILHWECGGEFEQVYRPPRRDAQWSDRDAVVVFRKPDGSISYPGRNDVPTPAGCERVEMRSMSAVDQFCRTHNVMNVMRDFELGTDRDHSTTDPRRERESEQKRYEQFRQSTRGVFGGSGGDL
jgi:hypothetical protein